MKKFLAALTVLVTLTVAVPVPNVDGHGEDTRFSASTVYASTEGQRIHEHLHGALEECGKKRAICFTCAGTGRCRAPHCHFGRIILELPLYEGGPTAEHNRGPCKVCKGTGKCQKCGGSGRL